MGMLVESGQCGCCIYLNALRRSRQVLPHAELA